MIKLLVLIFLFLPTISKAESCLNLPTIRSFIPKYAKYFKIEFKKDFKIISTKKENYLVAEDISKINCELQFKQNSTQKNVVMTSTTYLPTLSLLKKENLLVAFQGKKYIYDPNFQIDKIKDIGFNLNPESLMNFSPQLVLAYADNLQGTRDLNFFHKMQLPVVISYEHEEESALARAEWLIFNAAFLNSEIEAQKIFSNIEIDYLNSKAITKLKKKVLIGDIQNGFWVFPGAKSDFAKMLVDAGAELVLNVDSRETQRISLENLIEKNIKPDIWLLNNNVSSKKELINPFYKKFSHLLIYNYVARKNKTGANDFWESGISRPDLMIKDLISIINGKDQNLKWYRKL